MAAGLGFKTFTTGEVLTAADTNGYLMQGVLVFASSAARASAVTSPQEGQYSYLKDTNSTEYYDGAAWIAAPIGDITGVTAGTGISGGGTSGTVTVTNSMATEITAAGDIIVGTGSGTFDNLPIGTTAQVLTADTTVSPYKVKWATPASATSKVVQIVTATTNTQVSISTTTFTDTGLTATITPTSASNKVLVFISQNGLGKTGSTTMGYDYKLLRNATDLKYLVYSGGIVRTIDEVYNFSTSGTYLDAPATTSATTYKTQFRGTAATFACHAQYYNPDSSIVLMEVTP
jgi:hypothetical protein